MGAWCAGVCGNERHARVHCICSGEDWIFYNRKGKRRTLLPFCCLHKPLFMPDDTTLRNASLMLYGRQDADDRLESYFMYAKYTIHDSVYSFHYDCIREIRLGKLQSSVISMGIKIDWTQTDPTWCLWAAWCLLLSGVL
jgi:hypothetical protein